MMKRTALLLLAVCTLLATAACAKNETEQPSGTLKATNDAVDFYFYYPDTWQVYLDTGMIAVHYRLVIQRAQVAQIITYRIAGSTVTIQEILISPDERQINL